jgi:hypothetical protein
LSQNQWHPDPDVNKDWEYLMEALHRYEEVGGKTTLVLIPHEPEEKILVAINGRAVPADIDVSPREHIARAICARGQDEDAYDVITQCSSNNRSPGETVDGNVKELKIILRHKDGAVETLFQGPDFSPEEWRKKMESRGREPAIGSKLYTFGKS